MTLHLRHLMSSFLVAGVLAAACGNDDGPPPGAYGPGTVGALCRAAYDCPSGAYCCTSPPCGGGSCAYACRSDLDCPYGTLCDAGVCFLACRTDVDCYAGQHCKKDHTVCQY